MQFPVKPLTSKTFTTSFENFLKVPSKVQDTQSKERVYKTLPCTVGAKVTTFKNRDI